MIELVKDDEGRLLATVVRCGWAGPGATFVTDPADVLQAGVLRWHKGHAVPAHRHAPVERTTTGTGEALLVMRGMVRVTVEGREKRLGEGDAVVFTTWARHGLEVLSEEALVFECKSGPYLGRSVDKEEDDGQAGTEVRPTAAPAQGEAREEKGHGALPRSGAGAHVRESGPDRREDLRGVPAQDRQSAHLAAGGAPAQDDGG